MREALLRAADAGATEVAQEAIETWATGRLRTYEDAERGLCFGRIDSEESADPLYVGRRWIHDDARRALVVNWQAPAARPFYTATPAAPHGVTLRRRFRTKGRTLTGISDEALDGSLADAGAVDDFLLEELDRARDARMRDIVATIQADQYHLIARDPEPPLVIQGGPGTGKTAVGLHRASFLLYAHRERLRRVLVVGPNPAFMEYVSHVLPTLGEDSVDQRAVAELVPGVELTRADPPDVQRLKADTRVAEVVQRAAALASAGEPQELVVRLEGRFVGVEAGRGGRAARRGARRARPDRRRARALPDERAAALLRGLRRPARRPGVPRLRGGRARAAPGRTADAVPRRELAGAEAGAGRPPAALVAGAAGRGRRRRAGRGRAAAPAPCAQRLERGRPAAAGRGSRGAATKRRPATGT